MDAFYTVFADWARRFGVDAAVSRFGDALAAGTVSSYRQQFLADKAKVQAGGPPIITAGAEDWYSGSVETDRFWPALAEQFENEGWDEDRIDSVNRSSGTVVAHTPRPDKASWNAKGLVVGYVQSGKTTNFTAVIAKAADVQYRLVIVLSGIHNGLRRQTQVRLDEYLKDLNPDDWIPMTSVERDFVSPTHGAASILNLDKPVLVVVKKNAAVLTKLIKWLGAPNARKALESAPALVIDDEADQASVATGRINPLLLKLLGLMPRCTYVGYTATPFANVFVDPAQDDLYPKSFILNLPRPDSYFGPEKIFGRYAVEWEDDAAANEPLDGYDMVRTVQEEDVPLLRPGGKESAEGFTPTMIDELIDAVRWFWLATAARRARHDTGHSTMLIHTSVKIAVHESYRAPLEHLRTTALKEIATGDEAVLDKWRALWEAESARVSAEDFGRAQNSFTEVLEHLAGVVEDTRVVLDNYRSQDRLDYSEPSVVAIAVGGNTLSRGLTLEGLVVSFFVRGATAYDTLLQMGRWFGYRGGYEDLPRIWMTPSLEDAFRHLATVEHEMRDDIDRYQRENLTPTQVAVRIRTHPSLRITAKMGAAQPAYISYAGRRLQTRYFLHRDKEWLDANLEAAQSLVQEAVLHGDEEPLSTARLIRNVPVSLIKTFLGRYEVHEDSPDLDRAMMIKYIDSRLADERPSLATWSVAVVIGEGAETRFGGLDVQYAVRSRLDDARADRADIKTLMSKQDRALDLGLTVAEARQKSEDDLVKLRNADKVHHNRGLLVLYLIDPLSTPAERKPDSRSATRRVPLAAVTPVVGMGITFPGDPSSQRRIQASHVAVDLSDVESENLDEALDVDTEELA
ncbi:Z1 domain-containing protein [Actinoplanes sp. NPDC051861]|uniref:Z1 domain-containing protein n=1 Tax=Actinoplanes sp. NPDC051861 TaxID=3155170 RepID=UPI003439849B